jgi:hypothetical protein
VAPLPSLAQPPNGSTAHSSQLTAPSSQLDMDTDMDMDRDTDDMGELGSASLEGSRQLSNVDLYLACTSTSTPASRLAWPEPVIRPFLHLALFGIRPLLRHAS